MRNMPNAKTYRHLAGFQYRLRFFHKCRSLPSQCCDPGQIDRFQIQGSSIESTCGAPIIVVLVRYKHDPESGISRECQRAQFAHGTASFAVKVVVTPADQVLAYMDQRLLQQPRLVDFQGRNILGGPDVSPDGCIYATPLEKNGIAHLNNFCLMYPYTGQPDAGSAPASGSGSALGQQSVQESPSSGSQGSKLQATRRLRDMLGQATTLASGGGDGGSGGGGGGALGGGSKVLKDFTDILHSNGELCLLVQLLRRDAQQPGRWFAYDMPHLISRPFKVVPRSALPTLRPPAGSSVSAFLSPQVPGHAPALGRGLSLPGPQPVLPGHVGMGSGTVRTEQPPAPQPQPFVSPQYTRMAAAAAGTATASGGGFGSLVVTGGLAAYDANAMPGRPSHMGAGGMGSPVYVPQDCGAVFSMGRTDATPMGSNTGMGMGLSTGEVSAPMSILSPGCSAVGLAASGGVAGVGFGGERGSLLSSFSSESLTAGGSQRVSRARMRSLLSKDSSIDDSSVGVPVSNSGGATGVAFLRTPSVTSGMKPAPAAMQPGTALAAAPVAAGMGDLGGMASGPGLGPSPPFSPSSRGVHAADIGLGGGLRGAAALTLERGPSLSGPEEALKLLPLQLGQAPSATLMDMNISDLLIDIQPQPLLGDDMMELEEGAAKRVRSHIATPSDLAGAFTLDSNSRKHLHHHNHSSQLPAVSPRAAVLPAEEVEAYLSTGGGSGRNIMELAMMDCGAGGGGGGGGGASNCDNVALDGLGHPSRADSWSAEISQDQLLILRTQSTGLSGTHARIEAANASTSMLCSGATLLGTSTTTATASGTMALALGSGPGGAGGHGCSGGSSASQLDVLVQLLGQPGAMQDAMDRMDQEQQGQQQQGHLVQHTQQQGMHAYYGATQAQPQISDVESMQV